MVHVYRKTVFGFVLRYISKGLLLLRDSFTRSFGLTKIIHPLKCMAIQTFLSKGILRGTIFYTHKRSIIQKSPYYYRMGFERCPGSGVVLDCIDS